MGRAKLWAALIVGAAALTGCGEVEKCHEGLDEGCLGSAPDDSMNCRFGLVSYDGVVCEKPRRGASTDAGTVIVNDNCSCPSGQLCSTASPCIDPCKTPSGLPPVKPVPKTCRPGSGESKFDFQRASVGYCEQNCIRRAEICGGTCNLASECSTTASVLLTATCNASADPVECAMKQCETARDLPCAQQQCPVGSTPNCNGITCSNSCDMKQYNNDGICDDGDLSNAYSFVCEWGTDCGDCGPRRGSMPQFRRAIGEPCVDPAQCGGDITNVRMSSGWCLPPDTQQTVSVCLVDCSLSRACRPGFVCDAIASDPDGDGPMKPVQIEDSSGTKAYACFPSQCGS